MYNSIHFIQEKNRNNPYFSYSLTWLRTSLIKCFPSRYTHSSKSKCAVEVTWFDQRLKAEEATVSWQRFPELAGTEILCTQLASPPHCRLPRLQDHEVHQRVISETLFTHTVWRRLFFFPAQNEPKFNCQIITIFWIALLFSIYFTVTASSAVICTESNCGPFLKEFMV